MNVKMKKLISITPERLLVRIKKFDITDEQRDYLLSTQAMMQIKFNSNDLMWSVEQIQEKLDYYKMMTNMGMTLDDVSPNGVSSWINK
jgi:hypothetical protein|tara:strand:- start:2300 stop:2563 length:264 start_codon:yes stop_codon:yes gene_type:complete